MLRMYAYEKEEDGTFYVEAEIDTEADALLLQKHFRDAIQVNRGTESRFGYDEMFNEVLEMDYPSNTRFRLAYAIVNQRTGIMMTLV